MDKTDLAVPGMVVMVVDQGRPELPMSLHRTPGTNKGIYPLHKSTAKLKLVRTT